MDDIIKGMPDAPIAVHFTHFTHFTRFYFRSASTHVTERLTQRVMDDMIKVTVDAREFNWGRKKNDKLCDVPTGMHFFFLEDLIIN